MQATLPVDPAGFRERLQTVIWPILSAVIFTFFGYLAIGIQLSILPTYVVGLGFSSLFAGLTISIQYVATIVSRPSAGRMADSAGPRKSVVSGLIACGISGLLLWLSAWPGIGRWTCLGLLVSGRLALGVSESWVSTGSMLWGIAKVGPKNMATVIAWNGAATYGALAVGAPLGVILEHAYGFRAIGLTVFLLAVIGLPLALLMRPTTIIHGEPLPLKKVFTRVLPYGLTLTLGAVGFGTIATFITLYYASRGWSGAVSCLSVFGLCFLCSRLLFASSIQKRGGFPVAFVSFLVESVGLSLLWLAPVPLVAFAGSALSGLGFALVFPSLGVELVRTVTPQNRGAVLGIYSGFFDLALGVAGPVAGLIAGHFGYAAAFLAATIAALSGAGFTRWLARRPPSP